jgi:predicted TIM-barrel fold metal-dependent hydrolase
MERAIEAGATGLKFYPPSGYRPSGTVIPEPPDPWFILPGVKRRILEQYASRYELIKGADAVSAWSPLIPGYAGLPPEKALDAINRLAFEKAHQAGLVLFSHHTNSGFEAWKGYGRDMAAPCHWWDVLRDLPDLELILAHSGGGRGWFGGEKRWQGSFARQAFNLCVTFENVYCDFGYLDEVLEGDGPERLRSRLLELAGTDPVTDEQVAALDHEACVERQLPRRYDIRDKLLYGSDWMMSVAAGGHRGFVDDFGRVFSGDELGPWRDEFFCRNAAEIMGLEASTCDPPRTSPPD